MSELMLMIVSIFVMMLIPVVAMLLNSMMRGAVPEGRENEVCPIVATSDRIEVERVEYMTRGNIRLSLGMVDEGDSAERSKYDADLAELIP